MTHYRAALQSNELNARAHNNLGLLYRDKGLLDDAVRHFQRALLIDPRYVTARNNLGVALLGQGKIDEARCRVQAGPGPAAAERRCDWSISRSPSSQPGRNGVAMETLVRALAVDGRSAAAHYNLAVLYDQSGEAGRAVEHYRAFLDHAGPQEAGRAPEVRSRIAELAKVRRLR